MSFAIVRVEPFEIVKTIAGDVVPEPLIWPNGNAMHGITVGVGHGPWMFVAIDYEPDQPSEFHQITDIVSVFDGTRLIYRRTWTPIAIDQIQSVLCSRVDERAEIARAQYGSPSAVHQAKLIEAIDLGRRSDAKPEDFPLLAASLGIDGTSLAEVAGKVLGAAKEWKVSCATIETKRLGAKQAIRAAKTLDEALAASRP